MIIKLALLCSFTILANATAPAVVPPVDKGGSPPAKAAGAITLDDAACAFENKAEEINKQAEHCDKIPKVCMKKLPYKDLNQTCLSKITFVDELEEAQFKAIIEGGVKHIPANDKFVIKLVKTVKGSEVSANFINEFLKTKELSDIFFKAFSTHPTKMSEFITEATVLGLSLEACKQLGDENVINALSDSVFKKIEGNCLHVLPPSAFKMIRAPQLTNINLAALEHLTAAQVKEMPDPVRRAVTSEAAGHWGPIPNVPRNWYFNKTGRKEYLDNHPCSPAIDWEKSMEKGAWETLSKRCEPIWKVIGNAAPSTLVMNSSVLMLVLALVLSTLV